MDRRRFLFAAAMAASCSRVKTTSLGMLAYVDVENLWLRDLPNGQPRRLAAGHRIAWPQFSPSGHWISFQDGTVGRVVSTGTNAASGRWNTGEAGQSMKWVGNRDELAVCLANAASAERGDRLQVFTAADNWRAPQWSIPMDINADVGLALAFSTNSDRYAYSSTLSKGANSDGSVRVQTTLLLSSFGQPGSSSRRLAESQGSFDIAGFTRAGKWLLYWKEDEVSASILADGLEFFAVNIADGSKPHKLDIETLVYGDMIAICPTKEGVAVTSGFGRETWANKAIAIVDLNSGEPAVRVLTEPAMAAQLPAWSPNGETLAWCSGPDAEFLGKQELLAKGQKTIMVEGPRQGQRKQIPITPQLRLGADPQTVQRCMRSRRIYTANLSKNDRPQQLTNDSQYADEQPIWSANGDHILFCRLDAKDARTIWLMRNNGAEARQIAGPLRPPPEIYYGHTEWRSLFDWWRGPVS